MTLSKPDLYGAILFNRVLSGQNPLLAQIFLDAAVLEKYKNRPEVSLVRTNTIGRIKGEERWALDFGICPGEKTIHVSLEDFINILPAGEKQHWIRYMVTPPMSQNYVKTRLQPGSCIDDGDLCEWG